MTPVSLPVKEIRPVNGDRPDATAAQPVEGAVEGVPVAVEGVREEAQVVLALLKYGSGGRGVRALAPLLSKPGKACVATGKRSIVPARSKPERMR